MIRRTSYILLLIAVTAAFTGPVKNQILRYDFVAGSTLTIDGTSTVHDYSCTTTSIQGFLTAELDASGKFVGVADAHVTVPLSTVDCGKSQMNENLRKALKAKDHPTVTFSLKNAVVADQNGRSAIKANGQLTVAGSTKPIEITLTAVARPDGAMELQGNLPLKMTTFEVKPPTMFLGTLKTSDDVNISFKVVASQAKDA